MSAAMSTWQNGVEIAAWLSVGTLFTDAAMRWSGETIVTRISERAGLAPLTPDERCRLETWRDNVRTGLRRIGRLVTAGGRDVAVITAVYLPDRIGNADVIRVIQSTDTPLGLALRPLNVTRHPLMCHMRACGPWAVESSAVLRLPGRDGPGLPVAIATEQVYRSFAAGIHDHSPERIGATPPPQAPPAAS